MIVPARITEIHSEASFYGSGKLTGREREFLNSIHAYSRREGFTGLSVKQAAWFEAMAAKLEATRGMHGYEAVAMQARARLQRYSDSYAIACFGR